MKEYRNCTKETMWICNGEKRYELIPYLSVSDELYISEKIHGATNIDYRLCVAEIIAKHTNGIFSSSEIYELDDSIFEQYIDICVLDDSRLKKNYDSLDIADKNQRFITAINETGIQLAKELSEVIQKMLNPHLSQMAELTKKNSQQIAKFVAKSVDVSEALTEITSAWQELFRSTWNDNLKNIIRSYKNITPDYSKLFSSISLSFQDYINKIHVPSITNEDKERLINTYIAWGKLGWTLPPHAKLTVFSKAPVDSKDAYQRLRRYFSNSAIDGLFNEIRELRHIKKSDFEEAVSCFKASNYKACAMILFSIIDSRLIRSQLDTERIKNKRPSGVRAADNLFKRIKTEHITENMLFTMLDQVNILAALETVFDNGNDFKAQPETINRNFIDHGMLHRKVRRKDCIILFLLLYNFTVFLNSFAG